MQLPKIKEWDDLLLDLYPIAMVAVLALFIFGLWKFIFSQSLEAYFK